jgi:hypothetical protein
LLVGFFDFDEASDLDDWNFTIGYVLNIGSRPITLASNKQHSLPLCSVEAKFQAMVNASR